MALPDLWIHDEVKISSIHIRVTKHLPLCQGSEGGEYTRFPCSAFAADDNQLLHSNLPHFTLFAYKSASIMDLIVDSGTAPMT